MINFPDLIELFSGCYIKIYSNQRKRFLIFVRFFIKLKLNFYLLCHNYLTETACIDEKRGKINEIVLDIIKIMIYTIGTQFLISFQIEFEVRFSKVCNFPWGGAGIL